MSEKTNVCKALGAMFHKRGEPTDIEVTFVANAAMELGLDGEESEEVMGVLKEGGDYDEFVKGIGSKMLKTFFFRRVVAATLMDEKVEDDELELIDQTASLLAFKSEAVKEYLDWMKEGIAWEKRGAAIVAKL